jgi:hypothetical protein
MRIPSKMKIVRAIILGLTLSTTLLITLAVNENIKHKNILPLIKDPRFIKMFNIGVPTSHPR